MSALWGSGLAVRCWAGLLAPHSRAHRKRCTTHPCVSHTTTRACTRNTAHSTHPPSACTTPHHTLPCRPPPPHAVPIPPPPYPRVPTSLLTWLTHVRTGGKAASSPAQAMALRGHKKSKRRTKGCRKDTAQNSVRGVSKGVTESGVSKGGVTESVRGLRSQ